MSPTSVLRTDPVYQALLADAKFHEQLLQDNRVKKYVTKR
jgi:hypothetical protein